MVRKLAPYVRQQWLEQIVSETKKEIESYRVHFDEKTFLKQFTQAEQTIFEQIYNMYGLVRYQQEVHNSAINILLDLSVQIRSIYQHELEELKNCPQIDSVRPINDQLLEAVDEIQTEYSMLPLEERSRIDQENPSSFGSQNRDGEKQNSATNHQDMPILSKLSQQKNKLFTCEKCHTGDFVTMTVRQRRAADEPADEKYSCSKCGSSWKR